MHRPAARTASRARCPHSISRTYALSHGASLDWHDPAADANRILQSSIAGTSVLRCRAVANESFRRRSNSLANVAHGTSHDATSGNVSDRTIFATDDADRDAESGDYPM